MRKTTFIALVLLLMVILSACVKQEQTVSVSPLPKNNVSGVDPSSGEWVGLGDSFAFKSSEAPENTICVLVYQDDLYYVEAASEKSFNLWKDNDVLFAGDFFCGAASALDGVWVVQGVYNNGEFDNILSLLSPTGNVLRSFSLNSIYHSSYFASSLRYAAGVLYLSCDSELIVISENGTLICTIKMPSVSAYVVKGNDDNIYVVDKKESNNIYLVDTESSSLASVFTCSQGNMYDGNDSYLLLLATRDGLYGLQQDGNISAIMLCSECSLSFIGLFEIVSLSEGSYHCLFETGANYLVPVRASDVKTKTPLTIATIGQSDSLQLKAATFNQSSDDYFVRIVDYTDGGTYTKENAVLKLNTEIMSGNYPDMVCFSAISPFPFISKGLLIDMQTFIEQDPEMSLEDISIRNALDSPGGIYYIDNKFTFITLIGRNSQFGDRFYWTISEYLNIEDSLPDDVQMIYNMTKETFIEYIASRYIRTAVNWPNGTCDFYNDDFIAILEASQRIRETPEDKNNLTYFDAPVEVAAGRMITASSYVSNVWELAYEEQKAGCRLSFIGWPTVDGTCGSDVWLSQPIGIISEGKHPEGCWEFLKFTLINTSADAPDGLPVSAEHGLPVYTPTLQAKAAAVKASNDYPVHLTDSDIERFFELISSMENVNIYDGTILKIISEESKAFFNGKKTSTDAAQMVQSRASLYVAEQS